jgi:PAS domain-containing protein
MFPKEVEVILARHLASCLAMPIVIVDPDYNLVYYNEPAEAILGRRFEETGEVPAMELYQLLISTDEHGNPLPLELRPMAIALMERRPAFRNLWLRGLDGVLRHIEITAFPLIGQADRFLGVMAIFWEVPEGL